MRTVLLTYLMILSTQIWAQDISEEALILNQELQFLEESARGIKRVEVEGPQIQRKRKVVEESLERTYFGEEETDTISTRTAGPKRRGL